MKKLPTTNKPVLVLLQEKFKDAGCECSLKDDKNQTLLIIGYPDFRNKNSRQIA